MALPDPERSRVVLIGTSRFTDPALPDLPAVRNNLMGLGACFRDPARWGLPAAHCVVVPDPDSVVALVDPIHDAAAEAEDTLLIYYAGHGLVHPRTLGLLLAVTGSRPGRTHTSVPYDEVRNNVIDSPAERKVVILDCCYSGRAAGGMADPASAVANEATVEGTYLLASAPPNKQALSPPGETYTAFTGALLTILSDGVPNGPEFLQLDAIYRHVRDALKRAARPEPQLRVDNTAGELALVRNMWRKPSVRRPVAPVVDVPIAAPPTTKPPAAKLPTVKPPAAKPPKKRAKPRSDAKTARVKGNPARQRIKELLNEAGLIGWYNCPICQVVVAGDDLARHVDEHRRDEVAALDPATITLDARQRDLDNRYRLGEPIGGREPARTCLATDLRTDRTVVVKQLPNTDLESVHRAAAFDHPGIVRILDVRQRYLVLEYVDGQVLAACYPMPVPLIEKVVAEVCDALSYGHQRGVVHGQLNSLNVMLTSDAVKILNFGTRHVWDEDIRSDIRSAGLLLRELFGERPLLESLYPIVDKATHSDPASRYQSAAEMRDALTSAH